MEIVGVTLAEIAHVGPGTPCGEWFRRYWIVVVTARELHDIPQAVKVLGEDLVLFRIVQAVEVFHDSR